MIHSKDVRNLADTAPAPTPTHALRGMVAVVDGPSALRAFLAALDVPRHESSMVQLGFGDITAFAGFDVPHPVDRYVTNARYTLPSAPGA